MKREERVGARGANISTADLCLAGSEAGVGAKRGKKVSPWRWAVVALAERRRGRD